MPRLYVTPLQFAAFPAALTFPNQVAQINSVSGAMDMMLASASERCDAYARKRLQAPGSTQVASSNLSPGATLINVLSTLGFDNDYEQAVILNPGGGSQETIAVVPGGVNVTSWARPYPGTIQLAAPTTFAHNVGETVQCIYQEVSTVGSSSSSDTFSDSLIALNQAAQIARAHAPAFDAGNLTRVIFLKNYPITSLLQIEHMLPFDTGYATLFPGATVGIAPSAGYLRLPLGAFVLPEGLVRITYTAGYANVPDVLMRAASWYAADELLMMYSMGTYENSQGKMKGKYVDAKTGKSLFELRAELLLDKGFKRRT